jgi:hypothetical protein
LKILENIYKNKKMNFLTILSIFLIVSFQLSSLVLADASFDFGNFVDLETTTHAPIGSQKRTTNAFTNSQKIKTHASTNSQRTTSSKKNEREGSTKGNMIAGHCFFCGD